MSKLRHRESWYSRTKKELEEMDYKEKYEKALEWMKSVYPTMQGSDKEDAEHYFPELAENEDEKIRRELVEYLKGDLDDVTTDDTDRWINWLEKQKPRDYRRLYEEVVNSDWFKENYRGKSLVEEQKPIDPCDASWDAYYQRGYQRGLEVGRKEQKPIESCDGICCGDDRFKIIGEAKKDIIEKTNIAENKLSMELPLLDGILTRVWQTGWLNKKQKPEWSEEDEKQIRQIERIVKDAGCTQKLQEQIHNWFKSLRPQPKEEGCDYITPNKKFFQWIYDRLVYVHKENPNVDYMMSFKKRIDNLVFDQYHWKPTEEQMEAFKGYIEDFQARAEAAVGGWNNFDVMIQLYEQLKAIKEDKK